MTETEFRRLVLEWQEPIHHLAYRMLGNEADAADATQEVFARVLDKLPQYDPARPLRPWLFRLAANVVRNFGRDRATRLRYEQAAPPRTQEDLVEQRDMEAAVQAHLQRLPAEAREIVALHFFNGLSQTEVADVLALPRTTVQSRLARALEQLRGGLRRSGQYSVAAILPEVMRAAPAPKVAAELTSSLLSLSPTPVAAGLAAGGILMAKKTILVAAIALSIGTGYLVGRTQTEKRGPERTAAGPDASRWVSRAEYDDLKKQLSAALASHARTSVPHATPAPEPRDAVAARSRGIDWTPFAELLSRRIDVLNAMIDQHRPPSPIAEGDPRDTKGRRALTTDERAKAMEVMAEFVRVVAQARERSPTPFFDERIFPEFIDAIFARSLGLSQEQRERLAESNRALLRRNLAGVDVAKALPTELLQVRRRLVRELMAGLRDGPGRDAPAQWQRIEGFAGILLEGDRTRVRLGVRPTDDGTRQQEKIVKYWRRAYNLEDSQLPAVRDAARTYLDRATGLLRERGLDGGDAPELGPDQQAELDDAMLAAQIEAERSFYELLTEQQRASLRGATPTAISIESGGGESVDTRDGHGM